MALSRLQDLKQTVEDDSKFPLNNKKLDFINQIADLNTVEILKPNDSKAISAFIGGKISPIERDYRGSDIPDSENSVEDKSEKTATDSIKALQEAAQRKREAFILANIPKLQSEIQTIEGQNLLILKKESGSDEKDPHNTIQGFINAHKDKLLMPGTKNIESGHFSDNFLASWDVAIKALKPASPAPTSSPLSSTPSSSISSSPPEKKRRRGRARTGGGRGARASAGDGSPLPPPPSSPAPSSPAPSSLIIPADAAPSSSATTTPTTTPTTPTTTSTLPPTSAATTAASTHSVVPPSPLPSPTSLADPDAADAADAADDADDDEEEKKTIADIQAQNLEILKEGMITARKDNAIQYLERTLQRSKQLVKIEKNIREAESSHDKKAEGQSLDHWKKAYENAIKRNKELAEGTKNIIGELISLAKLKDTTPLEKIGQEDMKLPGDKGVGSRKHADGGSMFNTLKLGEIQGAAQEALAELAKKEYDIAKELYKLHHSDSKDATIATLINSQETALISKIKKGYEEKGSAADVVSSIQGLSRATTRDELQQALTTLGLQAEVDSKDVHTILTNNRAQTESSIDLQLSYKRSVMAESEKESVGSLDAAIIAEGKIIEHSERGLVIDADKITKTYDNLSLLRSSMGAMLKHAETLIDRYRSDKDKVKRYTANKNHFESQITKIDDLMRRADRLIQTEKKPDYYKERKLQYGKEVTDERLVPSFKDTYPDAYKEALKLIGASTPATLASDGIFSVESHAVNLPRGFDQDKTNAIYEGKTCPIVPIRLNQAKDTPIDMAVIQNVSDIKGAPDTAKFKKTSKSGLVLKDDAKSILASESRKGLFNSIPGPLTMDIAEKFLDAHFAISDSKTPIALYFPKTNDRNEERGYKSLAEALRICCKYRKDVPLPTGYGKSEKQMTKAEKEKLQNQVKTYEAHRTKAPEHKGKISGETKDATMQTIKTNISSSGSPPRPH